MSFEKRQHSSRMRTARLPTVCVLVATTKCQYHGGRGVNPQLNKFEQVLSDEYQMSVVESRRSQGLMSGGGRGRSPGLKSWGQVPRFGVQGTYPTM